jgi:hypothetical protein
VGEDVSSRSLLHELAEGLQSVGNYLSALRRLTRSDVHARTINIDIVEKALDELGRSNSALHDLRTLILASESKAEEAAAPKDGSIMRSSTE